MPSLTIVWGKEGRGLFLKMILPSLLLTMPEIVFKSVDLPAQFAPIIVTISPLSTAMFTPLSAWMPP